MPDTNGYGAIVPNVNLHYVTDLDYAIRINRWLLKPLGAWPMSHDAGGIERTVARIVVVVCSFLLSFVFVPASLYTFVKERNAGARVKLLGPLSFCIMAIFKYCSLITGRRDIGRCISHLAADWRSVGSTGHRDIMLENAMLGHYSSVVCALFVYGGGFFYACVMPMLQGSVTVAELNVTFRTLAYPSYYVFFDPQENTVYEIVYSIHCCCAFVMHSIAAAGCSLGVVFVMHACGQLEVVMSKINSVVDGDGKDTAGLKSRIAQVVQHHVRALRFVSCTEEVLRMICLIEVGGCTLNLCLLGHYFLLEWEQSDAVVILTYTILMSSFTFNIFLFCFIGELLTDECRKVGETTYMIDWYRLPGRQALDLILTIATAHRPTTITAGSLVELSRGTFCQVIRTAVAYLNLLRTVVL